MILHSLQNKEYSVSVIQALPVFSPAIGPPRTPCSSHMEINTTLRSLTIWCTYKLSNCFPCSVRPFSPLKSYLYFKDKLHYLLPVKSSCTEVITPFTGLLQCFINQYIYYNAHSTANYWNACLLYWIMSHFRSRTVSFISYLPNLQGLIHNRYSTNTCWI